LKPLHSLRKLYLSGNPFICDCRLRATVLLCERRYIYTDAICNRPQNFSGSAWQIMKEKESCDGHEQHEVARDVPVPIVVVSLLLVCGFCALFILCYWWRRWRRSSSGHQGRRTYDDVGLPGLRENVFPHAPVPDYASILSELPNRATNGFTCNVSSSCNNISFHTYDYVRNLESENISHLPPHSKCPKSAFVSGVSTRSDNSPHAYDDVGNQISEDGSYILPNSA
jgi:hypothetical protein